MDDNVAKNNNNEMLMQGTEKLASGDTELSLSEIQGVYNDTAKDYAQLVENAAQDVGNRQQQLIGNNFGAVNPYMKNTYYNAASSTGQSAMRQAGTQAALEIGMERGKQAAKDALNNAKNNYSNAQNAYNNAKSAYENAQQQLQNQRNLKIAELQGQDFGEGTSTAEAMQFAGTGNYDKEYYYDMYRGKATSDKYVKDWNVQPIRDAATDATLQQFGMTRSDLDNMSQEQRDAFWSRKDIGNYWTNQYASRWIGDNLGNEALQQYTDTYNKVTEAISQMYDYVTGVTDNIDNLFTSFSISPAADASVGDIPVPIFGIENNAETLADVGVYSRVDDAGNTEWYVKIGDEKEVSFDEIREKQATNANLIGFLDTYELKNGNDELANTNPTVSNNAAKRAILKSFAEAEPEVKYSHTEDLNTIFQNTFGFSYNDAQNIINFRKEKPELYDKFINEVTMAAAGLDLLEVADGKKSYHTAAGDEVFDEGTVVMYTLPGYTDADGNILDPDLKEYVNLRKQMLNPTAETDVEKLDQAAAEAYNKYMKGVQGQLFALNNYGLTINNDTTAAMLYLKNPTADNAKKLKIGDKTIEEFINEFKKMGTHEQFRSFSSLVKRMASEANSYIVKDGNDLTYMSKQDETGRETIGSEGEEDMHQDMSAEEALSKILVLDYATKHSNTDLGVNPEFFDAEQNDANEGLPEFVADFTRRFLYNLATDADIVTGLGTAAVGLITQMFTGKTGNAAMEHVFGAKNPLSITGRDNLVDLFTGDIEEGDLFYTEDRRTQQQDNLVKIVSPLLSDAWFTDTDDLITATGSGHASYEGLNAISNTAAELGGLIGPGIVESAVAGLIKGGVKAAAQKVSQMALKHSFSYADNIVSGLSDDALRAAAKEAGMSDDVIRYLSREKLEEIAVNKFDDVATKTDDVSKVLADETASVDNLESAAKSDLGKAAANKETATQLQLKAADEVAERIVNENSQILASLSETVNYADSLAKSSFVDDFADYFVNQIKQGVNKLDNVSENALTAIGRGLGQQVAKKTINTALVSNVLGKTISEIADLPDNVVGMLAAGSRDAVYKQGVASTRSTKFLGSMSAEGFKKTANDLVGAIAQRVKAGGIWTDADTLRFLSRKGWTSENALLNAQKLLRDYGEDMARDIIYGYSHPTLTNEGTDRETIDEYLSNPFNYLFNAGASIIQKVGSRVFNHVGSTVTAKKLEKAHNALASVDRADTEAMSKAIVKINKLNDKAQRYADKALERGLDYDTVMNQARKADNYAQQAMLEAVEKNMITFDPDKIKNAGKHAKDLQSYLESKRGTNAQILYAGMNAATIRSQNAYLMGLRSMGAYDNGLASITDKALNARMLEKGMLARADNIVEKSVWDKMSNGQKLTAQKKIYDKMREAIVDDMGGAIPGLNEQLEYYFDELLELQKYGIKHGHINSMRQGFIPINSMVVSPYDVPIAVRGYSFGVDLEAAPNFVSPNAALPRETFDYDIVKALQNGDTTIDHVTHGGEIEPMEIYAEGLNFLDNLTVYRNTLYRDMMMSPVLGHNRKNDFAKAQFEAGGIISDSKKAGTASAALDLADINSDIDAIRSNMKPVASEKVTAAKRALEASKAQADNINKSNARAQAAIRKNTKEIEALKSNKVNSAQDRAYAFLNSHGYTRNSMEQARNAVMQDIKYYQQGNAAGRVMSKDGTAEVQYGMKVKNTYTTNDGKTHTRTIHLDADYVKTLDRVSKAGASASDTDIADLLVLKANQLRDKEAYVASHPYDGNAFGNTIVARIDDRDVTVSQVAKVPANTDYGMRYVENILTQNMNLAKTKDGSLTASSARLLDSVMQTIRVRAEDADGKFFVADAIEYADSVLPDLDLHQTATQLGLYQKLNSLDANGFTISDLANEIDTRIAELDRKSMAGQPYSETKLDTLLDARAMVDTINEYSNTAKGKGSWDIGRFDDVDLDNNAELTGSADLYGNADATADETLITTERNITDEDGVITGETLPEKLIPKDTTLDKESFMENMKALDSVVTEIVGAEDGAFAKMRQARINTNNAIKDIADDINTAILKTSKSNKSVADTIKAEAANRAQRQGTKSGAKYDAIHAYGIASPESGITLEKSPTQYRAAIADIESGNPGYSQSYNQMLLQAGTQGGHLEQIQTRLAEMRDNGIISQADYDRINAKVDKAIEELPTFQRTETQFQNAVASFAGDAGLTDLGLSMDQAKTARDIVTRLDRTRATLQKAKSNIDQKVAFKDYQVALRREQKFLKDNNIQTASDEFEDAVRNLNLEDQSAYETINRYRGQKTGSRDPMELGLMYAMGGVYDDSAAIRIASQSSPEALQAPSGAETDIVPSEGSKAPQKASQSLTEGNMNYYTPSQKAGKKTMLSGRDVDVVRNLYTRDITTRPKIGEPIAFTGKGGKEYNAELDFGTYSTNEGVALRVTDLDGNEVEMSVLNNNAVKSINEQLENQGSSLRLQKKGAQVDAAVVYADEYGAYELVDLGADKRGANTNFISNANDPKAKYYADWINFSNDIDSTENATRIKELEDENKKLQKQIDDNNKTTIDVDGKQKAYDEAVREASGKSLSAEDRKKLEQLQEQKRAAQDFMDGKSEVYIARNGVIYNLGAAMKGYRKLTDIKAGLGFDIDDSGKIVSPDAKTDKKNARKMRHQINRNQSSGDWFISRARDFERPAVIDFESGKLTSAQYNNLAVQASQYATKGLTDAKGNQMVILPENLYISDDLNDILVNVSESGRNPGKFMQMVSTMTNFNKFIQENQMAGGFSFVNALTIAQLRGAIFQDPRKMFMYLKACGDMRNSLAVSNFAVANMDKLALIQWESQDFSILNDFAAATSNRPGVNDGGVVQASVNNILHSKERFGQNLRSEGSIPKAMRKSIGQDIDTLFSDATFANAIPVLRGKMLVANYDSALSQLAKKLPNAPAGDIKKIAARVAYAETEEFFHPGRFNMKSITEGMDDVYAKNLRSFMAGLTGAHKGTTLMDVLTNMFFALRYKLMLSGRVYDGFANMPTLIRNKLASRGELEGNYLDDGHIDMQDWGADIDAWAKARVARGPVEGIGSLMAMGAAAFVTAKALGIPTAWDDFSFTDENDGSFKVPEVLQKFQTVGQIWLPNAYSEERGFYVDPNSTQFGIDTMSSIFTLQNSLARTINKTFNPESQYGAPQRGIGLFAQELGINPQGINNFLNLPLNRAIGDELIGSNLLSPLKAMYEVVMDSTYFGNNIWEKKKLPDGSDNPNYDPGRNMAASVMHLLNLDEVLDGGKGYNRWVKGGENMVRQDQVGTVKGSGILSHEYFTSAIALMDGDLMEALKEGGELPIKTQNLSSKAKTEMNTDLKNAIANYSAEYKNKVEHTADNDEKDAAFAEFTKKSADAVARWSEKYDYVLGQNQELVPAVTRMLQAFLSGEYDDKMYYVQNAYWKAENSTQIEHGMFSFLNSEKDLEEWLKNGGTIESFNEEKNRRTKAYNDALDAEYEARQALLNYKGDEKTEKSLEGIKKYLSGNYLADDIKSEQRIVNQKVYAGIHAKLDAPVGEFENFKEMKSYYESMIDATTSTSYKKTLAERYNQMVTDVLAPYVQQYGSGVISDAYFQGKGSLAQDIADYIIIPYGQNYQGKNPKANYLKDLFGVGSRYGVNLPSDAEVKERFASATALAVKGSNASAAAILDQIIDQVKKGTIYASDADYSKILRFKALLSARSKN